MLEREVIFSIIIGCLVVAILFILLLGFLIYYLRNKNKFIREKEEMKNKYQLELKKAELEIQEETLKQIGFELHDNIGQLVTIAKIQTQSLLKKIQDPHLPNLFEVISKALEEIRRLSKSLDPEALNKFSLMELLAKDRDRINQLDFLEMTLTESGKPFEIDLQRKTILYRVIQEVITNTLKHAQCSSMWIHVHYLPDLLKIEVGDNGKGFDTSQSSHESGLGLKHIVGRIQLINGNIELTSSPDRGTSYRISCPAKV
ncbi:MAG: hypothetical protein IPM34_11345 [Saprospiraceae bacterium]|nr:hypothetical protein [Saprospiraceae bacterium]